MRHLRVPAAIAVLLAMAGASGAASFKCQGPDGKVIFSDQRCPPTDEERIKELEAAIKKPGATPEQKASAQARIDAIRARALEDAEKKAAEKKPKGK